MEKNYVLKVNEHSLYFKSLESVKNWFNECGVEDNTLFLVDDEFMDLDDLEENLNEEMLVVNECMIERGDDYCVIELDEFSFED